MGLRPAKCYRGVNKRSYTRLAVTVPGKNYIGTSPGVRTRQFNMGNPIKDFTRLVNLRIGESMQIRDNAIESMRQAVNRYLQKHLGKEGYFIKIRIYPYQILRENKQAQGAGADRVQKGMSHPFGRPIGRAARVKEGQIILSALCDPEGIETVKLGLLRAGPKLGAPIHLEIRTDVQSIGSKPRTVREEAVVVKETTTEPGKEGEKGKESTAGGKDAKGKETAGGKTAPASGKTDAGKGKEAAGGKKDAGAGKKEEPKKDNKGKK